MIKKFNVFEAPGKSVVFAFGRFNPPTTGHEKLIDKTKQVAGSNDYRIYPSFSQNPNKDPLPHALKIAYMRKMFPKHKKNIIADKKAITAINIAVKLYDQGYTDLKMVAGSDRVKEFETLLKKYNGVNGKRHGYYKFDNIDVVSAGERDPDAEGVSGMSASKMRYHANKGEYDDFVDGLPTSFKDGKKLFRDLRKYMGIREQKDMGSMNDYERLRDNYLTGQIWNIGDLVEAKGIEGKIIQRGTNYITFNDRDGKVHKAWLHEVKQDKDVKDKAGTQPAKYFAGVSKKSKDARDAHFKKGSKMDDDNPAAYAPAPGDAKGKTKPSKHTKKYKQMFGEDMPQTMDKDLQEKIEGLVKKAEKSGISYGILKQVYNRGMAAWRTGHRPGTTPQQWAFARVNSFVTKSKGTWGGADKDLAAKARGTKEAYDIGKPYADHTKEITPGENKKTTKEEIEKWYKSETVQEKYELKYGNEWYIKLTETYKKLLEKVKPVVHENCGTPDCCMQCDTAETVVVKPIKEKRDSFGQFMLKNAWGEITEDAEYQGRKVKLNNPTTGDRKKYKVYVKNDKGNVVKVEFGDPNMSIKRDDPKRRASFRARHNCDQKTDKTTAGYWSCKFWSTKSVTDLMKG
mgnify:CR=1 FL=1